MTTSPVHLRLVDQMLEAIDQGKVQLPADYLPLLRQLRARILEGAPYDEFRAFVLQHPEVLNHGVRLSIERGIAFLESELEYYNREKRTRILTEEEKRYGKDCLIPLAALARLATGTDSPQEGD